LVFLEVPCFRYRGQDINAAIAADIRSPVEKYLQCAVRGGLYRATPEEHVRQALIWFLQTGSSKAPEFLQSLRLGVEERSLDVVGIYTGAALTDQFRPNVSVVVFETKRPERDINSDVDQLRTYLIRDNCRSGVLFNSRQAIWMEVDRRDNVFESRITPILDLLELERCLESVISRVHDEVRDLRHSFTAATAGDFDALTRLAACLGGDSNLNFGISVRSKNVLALVQATNTRIENQDRLSFRARAVASRNRQQLTRAEFHSLLYVQPL
jgi:hypothetical protein